MTTKAKIAPKTATAPKAAEKPKTAVPPSKTAAPIVPTKISTTAPVVSPSSTVVEAPQPVILGPVMRKRELIDLVVTRSGIKKKDAKPVIEAMLATLGEALADGRELILPPMGRMMVRKERVVANARIMTLKVRQSTGSPDVTPEADAVKPSEPSKI